jgi:hypothetical protein
VRYGGVNGAELPDVWMMLGATLVVALRPADVMDGLAKPIRGARRASGATTRVAPTAEPFVRDATLYQRPISRLTAFSC